MSKNLKVLGIGVLLIALAVGGWFLYTVSQSQNSAELTQNNIENQKQEQGQQESEGQVEELKTENIDTSSWKEYCNQEYGFCVKYPTQNYRVDDNNLADYQLVYIQNNDTGIGANNIYGLHITVGKYALTKKQLMKRIQSEVQNASKGDLAVIRVLKKEEMSIGGKNIQKVIASFPIGYTSVIYFLRHKNENFEIKCVESVSVDKEEMLCDAMIGSLIFE
jgi:uncharacterized protein YneF (UPF0154 family)